MYPHQHIWINGRIVLMKDIEANITTSLTAFEQNTFSFIRQWLTGQVKFELQTSGSTGAPKKIIVERSQLLSSALLTIQALRLDASHHALIALDTRYIAGRMMIVRCLEAGMKIFALEPTSNPFVKIPVDQTIHFAALVPYQVKSVLESKHPHLLDTINTCIIGGAPVDSSLKQQLQYFTPHFFETYGMTETVSHIALKKLNGYEANEYFKVMPGITISTDDRQCLVIQLPYLHERIITNDVVKLHDKDHFQWLGRYDNVINSGGLKFSPEVIEERVAQLFTRLHIQNLFFVHSIPDSKLGQKIILVIEGNLSRATLNSMREALPHTFSSYEIPRQIFFKDQFVFTNTAKINRAKSFEAATPAE